MHMLKEKTAVSGIFGIYRLLIITFVLLSLYFAQKILIPITLAALLTFLLSPLVTRLEKWLGRTISILIVAVLVFSTIGFIGYVLAKQAYQFGANIQVYNENIQKKFQSFHLPQSELFNKISGSFDEIKHYLFGETPAELKPNQIPIEEKLIDFSTSFAAFIGSLFGSVFNILGFSGMVFLLVVFMLFNREDIRSRIIKLMGQGKISNTTSLLDDASERVFTFLIRQFNVNFTFGIIFGLGLYLIGVPNAVLWGLFAAIMRFIPYIGIWIAVTIPIALSFIITDNWFAPFMTITFFIILELLTAYFIEPIYFGMKTGVSPFALIIAVIFWTWLWGPIGLLLSTPLTVCLVVIGQHFVNMNFLNVLLSQEEALTPAQECYHRLLSFDSNESMEVIDSYLKNNSILSLYDSVLIPIITQTETDYYKDNIDQEKKKVVFQNIREIVEYFNVNNKNRIDKDIKTTVFCIPAESEKDEVILNIVAEYLSKESFKIYTTSVEVSDYSDLIKNQNPNAICIAAAFPFTLSHILYLSSKMHQQFPKLPIIVCLFGFTGSIDEISNKIVASGATVVVFSLENLIKKLQEI